jgi:acyl-CoA synthetase (AMP-forming)/AMP-acid ligase II
LQAVLVAGVAGAARLLEPLAAALDGTGPAILPLDADLPAARLRELLDAFGPGAVRGPDGDTMIRSGEKGVADDTAVIIGTSGSTGQPKGVELGATALLASARASLARCGARAGDRWLVSLPVTHVAGLQVLVRSLASGTEPAALDGGEFVTSDLGYVSEGRVVVRGRADDVINTGGHKVVPGEVSAALQSCPGVRDVVVVGRADPEWGERVTAVVVPDDPADPPSLELLRTHVRERLPRYACPSELVLTDAIPVLPSGKPDLATLRSATTWTDACSRAGTSEFQET